MREWTIHNFGKKPMSHSLMKGTLLMMLAGGLSTFDNYAENQLQSNFAVILSMGTQAVLYFFALRYLVRFFREFLGNGSGL